MERLGQAILKESRVVLKEVDETGRFTCYAAAFGNADSDNEVIDKGAFKRSIQHKNGRVPILYGHDRNQPIGMSISLQEDEHGLLAEGQLILDVQRAKEAYALIKAGAIDGVSVGFRVVKDGSYVKDGVRHFKECELFEFSLCVFQANPRAKVTAVKSEKEESMDEILKVLEDEKLDDVEKMAALAVMIGGDEQRTKGAKANLVAVMDMADKQHQEAEDAHHEAAIASAKARGLYQLVHKQLRQTNYANDVNAPNPVGKVSSDPDALHSLKSVLAATQTKFLPRTSA